MDAHSFYIEAIDLRAHPIKKANKRMREDYFTALSYIIDTTIEQVDSHIVDEHSSNVDIDMVKKYITERLHVYQSQLFTDVNRISFTVDTNRNIGIDAVAFCMSKKCQRKYQLTLICDIALILFEQSLITQAMKIVYEHISPRTQKYAKQLLASIFNEREIDVKHMMVAPLIEQYRLNRSFVSQKERRIVITANMSAGKSTLINALIGKPLARTSQEACTGNICYISNKAFEDGNVHLSAKSLTMSATTEQLHSYEWTGTITLASYFANTGHQISRMCVIDTPGVNAALYQEHAQRTYDALRNDEYDMVLYVVSPTNLGTDAEIKHLQWVAQNLPKEKIVFVFNKLDNYRDCSDSIAESCLGLKEDLLKAGFEDPMICPISAYFSYLIKRKMTGYTLSEDEADEYAYLSKKFMRSSYDLSQYYYDMPQIQDEFDEVALSKRAGLYGLEKIIYGE